MCNGKVIRGAVVSDTGQFVVSYIFSLWKKNEKNEKFRRFQIILFTAKVVACSKKKKKTLYKFLDGFFYR